jgi:hypothetical protein
MPANSVADRYDNPKGLELNSSDGFLRKEEGGRRKIDDREWMIVDGKTVDRKQIKVSVRIDERHEARGARLTEEGKLRVEGTTEFDSIFHSRSSSSASARAPHPNLLPAGEGERTSAF